MSSKSAVYEQASSLTPWDSVAPDAAAVAREEEAYVQAQRAASGEIEVDEAAHVATTDSRSGGGAFTIPLICLGIGLIALCLLIPAADDIRRLAYERDRLKADLEQLQKQVATNDAFLKRVADDPALAERLARRQMKMVPEGSAVLELSSSKPKHDMSPFLLVTVPPPTPMPPYSPVGGFIANLVRHPKSQLYLIGGSLLMIATGLILSRSSNAS
jgi:hypothetical protein